MTREWSRRAASAFFALFFVAVAAAPHHHLNGLEDLLFDQPSDSGIIVQTIGSSSAAVPGWHAIQLVEDFPCLACFTRDFVCAPTASFLLVAIFAPLPLVPAPPATATPELLPAETSSRAPPRLS